MSTKAKIFWVVSLFWLAVDQATKLWVVANLAEHSGVVELIPGFFDLVHAENPGAAFSLFRDFEWRHQLFLGFTVVAIWVVWDQYRRLEDTDRLYTGALALIASGALGNAIDRLTKRTVTDFLRFHVEEPGWRKWLIENVGTNEYPSFNIADSVLLVGVVFFLFASGKPEPKPETPSPEADKATG